jgi:Ala-tRNA(Pro) deacylase
MTDATPTIPPADPYDLLLEALEAMNADYRLIHHAPEGRTDLVSALRGHPVREAAKCLILMAKLDRRTTRYVLAVVPGDARLDLEAVKSLLGARYVGFASTETAEALARSVSGTVLPWSLDRELELIADPSVLDVPVLYFNAARLDVSVAVSSQDWAVLARPRLEPIVAQAADSPMS